MTEQRVCIDCGEALVYSGSGRPPIRCGECGARRRREVERAKQKRWRQRHPEKVRALDERWRLQPANRRKRQDAARRRLHGITRDQYDAMLAQQDGVCAICRGGTNGRGALHVDHCHATGRRRGLLCHRCNTMLGLASDDPLRLEAAASYLRKHI